MRSLQSLTTALVALSITTGIATPSLAVPSGSTDHAPIARRATNHVANRATPSPLKTSTTWLSPIADTNQFERYFEQCANAVPEEALSACEQATALEPDVAIAWDNLGAVLEQLGRYEDALAALNRAVTLTPNDANIWYNVGVVLAKLHQYEPSVAAFEEAYRLNPEDELARKYAELLRGQFGD